VPLLASLFVTIWELYGIAFNDYLPEVYYKKQPVETIDSDDKEESGN
jgi:hypothetical protein